MDTDHTFLDQFNKHFESINAELRQALSTSVPLIEGINRHSLLGEGKRLRPLLFVLSGRLCGYQGDDIYRLSTIFECIHTASLLHDDVIDNADTRRKKPSAKHVWGNSAAVLCGDFLYSRSLAIATAFNNLQLLKVLTETTTSMAEGQVLELVNTHNWNISKDEYMQIIILKTAVLISAACACGAVISGAERRVVEDLGQFGLNLGIAFQLTDDLLDYTSSEEEFGKPVGKDLRDGRITLPLIYTLSELERVESERLEELFKNHRAKDEDWMKLMTLVRSNGIVDRIRSEAGLYADKAAGYLDLFPESPIRENLMDLNAYINKRSF
jgi:octaprenyl-diphosphate synthase